MTQLQIIIEELKSINPDTDLGKAWKDQAEINPVKVIHEMAYGLLHNYESTKAAVSVRALLLIKDFDALNEAESKLGQLSTVWSHNFSLPKEARDYNLIRMLNAEIELLFKIHELKNKNHE